MRDPVAWGLAMRDPIVELLKECGQDLQSPNPPKKGSYCFGSMSGARHVWKLPC